MAFKLRCAESDVFGKAKYVNDGGDAECVEFVRQATGAPKTSLWVPGLKVADARQGDIARGTAIATFDDSGHYPTNGLGKHAAIYLRHTAQMIEVLDLLQ